MELSSPNSSSLLKIQIQHLLKLNCVSTGYCAENTYYSNTTLVKVKLFHWASVYWNAQIQIQHLLKLNARTEEDALQQNMNSNTTLVKVKLYFQEI